MGNDSGAALHDYVAGRFPDLRRSAYLMCGDWALAGDLAEASLARLVAETRREEVDDPDGYVFAHLMSSFPRRPPRREHVFVAADTSTDPGDQVRDLLVLDALRRLAPRCRAVMVLRHWNGFAVDETADVLGLADERVEQYEAAGLAALEKLLANEADKSDADEEGAEPKDAAEEKAEPEDAAEVKAEPEEAAEEKAEPEETAEEYAEPEEKAEPEEAAADEKAER